MPSMDGGHAGVLGAHCASRPISVSDVPVTQHSSSIIKDCLETCSPSTSTPPVLRASTSSSSLSQTDKNGNNLAPSLTHMHVDGLPAKRVDNCDPPVDRIAPGRPVRKLSVGDLHIRSVHDDDPCREIRAILREIRDSLKATENQQGTGGCTATKPLQTGVVQSVTREITDESYRRAVWTGTTRRYCRLSSLPARLRPGHTNSLLDGDEDRMCSGRAVVRRVPPANVRFADEVGMNLNTFAMIPSRQARDDSPTCVPLPKAINHSGRCGAGPGERVKCTELGQPRDRQLGEVSPATAVHHDALKNTNGEQSHEQFRLCFTQPFAELEQFRRRLDRQLVCLENVRVDDWLTGPHHHNNATSNSLSVSTGPVVQSSFPAANSVILCSIQTVNASSNLHQVRVFARCTSDNWRTHADLPAQKVAGLDSLGLGYDRYCFAVRRPVTPDTRPSDEPSAAVEFAVCYEMPDCVVWDNNDDANYRIEWFTSSGT